MKPESFAILEAIVLLTLLLLPVFAWWFGCANVQCIGLGMN